MHNAALRDAGMAQHYEAMDVAADDLRDVLHRARRERWAGNVTIPHKVAASALCDRLTVEATFAGAVNTFWVEDDALIGDNTDVMGFDRACDALGIRKADSTVACIGAGGAAAAVCAATSRWPGATVRIGARRLAAARALAARFTDHASSAESPSTLLGGASLVVNCTPVGLHNDDLPVSLDMVPRDAAVMDLAYRPEVTAFVRAARARGHVAADGLEMLIQQGALAFQRWFQRTPDIDAMRRAIAGTREN